MENHPEGLATELAVPLGFAGFAVGTDGETQPNEPLSLAEASAVGRLDSISLLASSPFGKNPIELPLTNRYHSTPTQEAD